MSPLELTIRTWAASHRGLVDTRDVAKQLAETDPDLWPDWKRTTPKLVGALKRLGARNIAQGLYKLDGLS